MLAQHKRYKGLQVRDNMVVLCFCSTLCGAQVHCIGPLLAHTVQTTAGDNIVRAADCTGQVDWECCEYPVKCIHAGCFAP